MSLTSIWYELSLFDPGDNKDEAEVDLTGFLEALTHRNQGYLKDHPNTPRLYKSGVKYVRPQQLLGDCEEVRILKKAIRTSAMIDPKVLSALKRVQEVLGGEHFCDIGVILQLGGIDCFPLSQKIIVRSKSTGMYELLAIGELRFTYSAYEALSFNFETGKQEFRDIVGFVDKGMKAVSKAHLSNGTDLVATDSHKFWALDGARQQAPYPDSFRVGVRTMGEYVQNYADYKSGKMSRGMYTARSRILQAARIPALDAIYPSSAETYLAGIYAAEGFKGPKMTGIAQHKSPVRQKIETALAGVGLGFSYDKGHGATPGSGAQYRLLGGKKNEVIARLRDLGVDSFDKRFPQSYLSASAGSVREMLNAHADGDGWRPREGQDYKKANTGSIAVEYSTSSDALMEQIRLGLLVVGSPAYTYRQMKHQGEGDRPIWRIDEFNERASKMQNRKARMSSLGLENMSYATVRGAEPFGEAHVGCIEVEGNHNFFLADGTLAANCDGLASWRAAELRQAGIEASPYITNRPNPRGGTIYHVIVRYPDNTTEDPSLLLGMGGQDRAADRQEEIRKNAERCENYRRLGHKGMSSPLVPDDFNVTIERLLGGKYSDGLDSEIDKVFRRAA